MTRERILTILSRLRYCVLWPGDWKDIGFTERPIWVNHEGFGWYFDDEPCFFSVIEGVSIEYVKELKEKIKDGRFTREDIKETPFAEVFLEKYYMEDNSLEEFVKLLDSLPSSFTEEIYCGEDINAGCLFYASEEELIQNFAKDSSGNFGDRWTDMEDTLLQEWYRRLFVEKPDVCLPLTMGLLNDELRIVDFEIEEVPLEYQWGGYCQTAKEFKDWNFLKVDDGGDVVFVCATENAVALGEYLSRYILKVPFISDMEDVISPECDYWFFLACEQLRVADSEQDDWFRDLLEMLITEKYISKIERAGSEFYLFKELAQFEKENIPDELVRSTEEVCRYALKRYFEEKITDYGKLDESSVGGGGEWAKEIMRTVLMEHMNKGHK